MPWAQLDLDGFLQFSSKEPVRPSTKYWGIDPGCARERGPIFHSQAKQGRGFGRTKKKSPWRCPSIRLREGPWAWCVLHLPGALLRGAGGGSVDKQERGGALQSEMASVLPFQDLVDPLDRSSLL